MFDRRNQKDERTFNKNCFLTKRALAVCPSSAPGRYESNQTARAPGAWPGLQCWPEQDGLFLPGMLRPITAEQSKQCRTMEEQSVQACSCFIVRQTFCCY